MKLPGNKRFLIVLVIIGIAVVGLAVVVPGGDKPSGPDEDTSSENQFPPGVNDSGTSSELVSSHADQFAQLDSYTYSYTSSNLSVEGKLSYKLRVNTTTGQAISKLTLNNDSVTSYYDGQTLYRRVQTENETSVTTDENPEPLTTTLQGFNATIAVVAEEDGFDYNGTNSLPDGDTGYVYTNPATDQRITGTPASGNASVTVTIGPEGLVRRLTIVPMESGAEEVSPITARLYNLNNTTVEEPEWVPS